MAQPFIVQHTFRADLNAEELVHKRISACNDAFASGILVNIKFSVLALENCLLGCAGDTIIEDSLDLERAWESRYEKKLEVFKKKCIGAISPGLMQRKKPKHEPDFQHWRQKFMILIELCHQRGMWFKKTKSMKY